MFDHPVWRFQDQMPQGRDFEIYHATNTTPQPTIYHSHHYYEVYFILRGSIQVIAEATDVCPVLGDALIYPPHCMHRVTHTDPQQPYERFYLYLSREFLSSISTEGCDFADRLDSLCKNSRYCLKPGKNAVLELVPLADEIIEGAKDLSPAGILANRCRMVLYLLKVLALLEDSVTAGEETPANKMNEVIRYINRYAAQDLPLDHLQEVFGVSKFALLHSFKDYTGMSVHQYILTRRVILAQQLMQQGAKPREACIQSGFTDYTSFYRAFKARTGKSPAKFCKTKGD